MAAPAKHDTSSGGVKHYDATEHKMTIAELQTALDTNLNVTNPKESPGLSVTEAAERLKKNGPNAMSPPKQTPEIVKFLSQFVNTFMLLLILASVLSYIAYALDKDQPVNLYCAIALDIIVVLQCTASYLEERKSSAVMNSLKSMMPAACNVIRGGQTQKVNSKDLVVGDVVALKGGDRVPADVRVLHSSGLKVESSSLTGEPDAFEMTVHATHDEPHETKNLCFNTSQCTEGSAICVVIRVGDHTLIGMVATLATGTSNQTSTLKAEIDRIVKFIAVLAVSLALIVLCIGLGQGVETVTLVNLVITVCVANVPQGLPATVTSCLGIAAKRMFKRNVLVKNLEVIETLGSATCICSDKTGTLTQNKMSVQNFWFNGSFELLQGMVIVGATSTVVSGGSVERTADGMVRVVSGELGSGSDQGLERVTSSESMANPSAVRWSANPVQPLLLVAAVCNSAVFAAPAEGEGSLVRVVSPPPEKLPGGAKAETKLPAPSKHSHYYDPTNVRQNLASLHDASGLTQRMDDGVVVTSRLHKPRPTGDVIGDASESALLRYCENIYPVNLLRAHYPKSFDLPFNSTNKFALCVVTPPPGEADGKQYIFLKGAPEVVVERCTRWVARGKEEPTDNTFKAEFLAAYERFALMGQRVLGFARLVVDAQPEGFYTADTVPKEGFSFLGLASLMDPPKVGVDEAVDSCRQAGIRTFMVTGDHALTAEAIAHKVHIITLPTRVDLAHDRGCAVKDVRVDDPEIGAVVITGTELRQLDEDGWEKLLSYRELVFARTTPQQKLEIVTRLQNQGEVVAVTGDGVNDAPALKKAQIGVAMGNPNASDVAREAADIIILDDDFCSIVSAIREGRLLFDNLKKSVAYTLTHLVPEMVPIFLNIILLMPLGLSSLLILTVDLGSELVPAIALAYEDPENAIMQRKPRNIKTDKMVTWQVLFHSYLAAGVMEAVASTLAFFCVLWSFDIDLADIVFPDPKDAFTDASAPVFISGGKSFSGSEQFRILSKCNAAVYGNIIFCQMWHIWFCRTRATSVTQHPLFSNHFIVFAMFWEFAFIAIFSYINELSEVFVSGEGIMPYFWCLSLGFLVWVAVHTEIVKYCARKALAGQPSWIAKFAW